MSEKFLKVGAEGEYEEALGYLTSEFVDASAGAGDAGKPVKLDSGGKIDGSMVDASDVAHDSTSGVAASTAHTAFPLLDGTRPFTGIIQYNAHPTFSADTDLIDKKYVDDLALGFDWLPSVDTRVTAPTGSETGGERYMIIATATGIFAGKEDQIADYDGATWSYTIPAAGNTVIVEDVAGSQFTYDGAAWIEQTFESTTAGDGLQLSGNEISVAPTLAGDGLAYSTGVMSVNVDDSSIEIATDTLQVKALGITDAMLAGSISDGKLVEDYIKTSEVDDISIEFAGGSLNVKADGINALMVDWGVGANQVSAGDVPIADAGGHTSETDVEGSLQELYGLLGERGVELTSAGVSKGDLMYVSAANTLASYNTITTYHKAVGLANATVAAASPVKSLSNDTRLNGILSAATAGDVYYWDGTNHVNSIPSGSGSYVIQTGVAINATDLYVEVRPIKKNI